MLAFQFFSIPLEYRDGLHMRCVREHIDYACRLQRESLHIYQYAGIARQRTGTAGNVNDASQFRPKVTAK